MRESLAILATLGGRRGWRWWMPLAVYAGVAVAVRIWAATPLPGSDTASTSAAQLLFGMTMVTLILLWPASRYPISLGHRRLRVYLVLVAASCVLPLLALGVILAAGQVEEALFGPDAFRVLGLGFSTSEAEPVVVDPTMTTVEFPFWPVLGFPMLGFIVTLGIGGARWKGAAPIAVAVLACVLVVATAILILVAQVVSPVLGVLACLVVAGVPLVGGWFVFKEVPV